MPPRIRHAGPIALAVKGIREGAQAKFQAEEEERLRKYRLALSELAEKKRQANIRRQMDVMQERGRMARQAISGQQAMGRQAMAGQQDMARQAMQARREQMGQGAQMERMREQQGMMGEREESHDERAAEQAKQRHELDKKLETFKLTEKQELDRQRITQQLNDLDHSPDSPRMDELQRIQVRGGLLADYYGLTGSITPDQAHKNDETLAKEMLFDLNGQPHYLKKTFRNNQWVHEPTPLAKATTTPRSDQPGVLRASIRNQMGYNDQFGAPAIITPQEVEARAAFFMAEQGKGELSAEHQEILRHYENKRQRALIQGAQVKRNKIRKPILEEAKSRLEDVYYKKEDAKRTGPGPHEPIKEPRFTPEEVLAYASKDPELASQLSNLGPDYIMPEEVPDPSLQQFQQPGLGMPGQPQQGGQPQQMGMPQQGGMPQDPGMAQQGMPQPGTPLASQPQPIDTPEEINRAEQFHKFYEGQTVQAAEDPADLTSLLPIETTTSKMFDQVGDGGMGLVRSADLPVEERNANNRSLVGDYELLQSLIIGSSGTRDPDKWDKRQVAMLEAISKAAELPEEKATKKAPKITKPDTRDLGGFNEKAGVPKDGWSSRSDEAPVTDKELQLLLWMSRPRGGESKNARTARLKKLASSIEAMSESQRNTILDQLNDAVGAGGKEYRERIDMLFNMLSETY